MKQDDQLRGVGLTISCLTASRCVELPQIPRILTQWGARNVNRSTLNREPS
jgi:hypothetical protein